MTNRDQRRAHLSRTRAPGFAPLHPHLACRICPDLFCPTAIDLINYFYDMPLYHIAIDFTTRLIHFATTFFRLVIMDTVAYLPLSSTHTYYLMVGRRTAPPYSRFSGLLGLPLQYSRSRLPALGSLVIHGFHPYTCPIAILSARLHVCPLLDAAADIRHCYSVPLPGTFNSDCFQRYITL